MSGAADLVRVVGVRHHSPACARLVRHAIEVARPAYVLIEGPSDMNARVSELLLGHAPPVAVFTFSKDGATARYRSVWSPFCEHSPEWIALHAARDVGATARFMDLPAWHPAFSETDNRYGDRRGDEERARADAYLAKLTARFRVDDTDTLWDHLFEIPPGETGEELDALDARLGVHFDAIRGEEEAGPRDGPREAYMLECLAWAALDAEARGGSGARGGVVAVCGGWHRPALVRGLEGAIGIARSARRDAYPEPPPEGGPTEPGAGNAGSYLVPYSHRRLDSLSGYASGMPSPGFYVHVWREGQARAAENALMRIAARLRAKKQPVSTADLIACRATAEGLARIRAHGTMGRGDLLDAVAATLVKDALDVEVPWARRGPLRAGTDPVLVEVVAELAGDEIGRLAEGTPRPPLAGDVEAELRALDLEPGRETRGVDLDLTKASDLARSRVLHRLRVLSVPGFVRTSGPRWVSDRETSERWTIRREAEADARLVEVAGYGATLGAAARGALEERCAIEKGAGTLADALGDAILCGLVDFSEEVLGELEVRVREEPVLGQIGWVLKRVHGVHANGALLVTAGHATLARIVEAAFDRALWLLEGLGGGAGFPEMDVLAVVAIRDVARGGSGDRATAVFERRVADVRAAPAIRGACLGGLVSLGAGTSDVIAALKRTAPTELGDLLAGLFALAREEMTREPALVGTVDGLLSLATEGDFLAALPSLRYAFTYFPPRERAAIAERVAALHGAPRGTARSLLEAAGDAASVTAAVQLERRARETAARYGLLDAVDEESQEPV
ncbi:MAG: DUF5682 family protein [Polyangiaceae bacterium]